MAVLESEVRPGHCDSVHELDRRLFTRREYYTMGEAGFFVGQRVELIEGEIVNMAPIGTLHAAGTHPLAVALGEAFGPSFAVRSQAPISIGGDERPSEPQPDVAVVVGSWRDYLSHHPSASEIRLVVEQAESSIGYDRATKSALYASAAIPEYWIVNLTDNLVEVYRNPVGSAYVDFSVFDATAAITPLFAQGPVALADFLP